MFQFTAPPLPYFITCGDDLYTPGDTHPRRYNIGIFDLIFVTKGCLFLTDDSVDYTISQGEYIILTPDSLHYSTFPCQKDTHFYWLHFDTPKNYKSDLGKERFILRIPNHSKCASPSNIEHLLKNIMLLESTPSSQNKFKQQRFFHEILSLIQDKPTHKEKCSQDLIAERTALYINTHYKENLNYKTLSSSLHFHPNYISLCMKKYYGLTPLEYLIYYRLEIAKHLLIHTDKSIGAIAEETGFNSFQYFNRCFKKNTKKKPNEFRGLYR